MLGGGDAHLPREATMGMVAREKRKATIRASLFGTFSNGDGVVVLEVGKDDVGIFARANASLWVDGKRIYETMDMRIHIVDDQ